MAAAPGYYVREIPGSGLIVQLKLELVDRLLPEVMAGFGAVPRRGAEVGGILLGRLERGDRATVAIRKIAATATIGATTVADMPMRNNAACPGTNRNMFSNMCVRVVANPSRCRVEWCTLWTFHRVFDR